MRLAFQPQFDCVGVLNVIDNGNITNIGSCVLVETKYVISAAHCFFSNEYRDSSINLNGINIKMAIVTKTSLIEAKNLRVQFCGQDYKVDSIFLNPSYYIDQTCDIAVIRLTEEVKLIHPAILSRNSVATGTEVTGVGFGTSGPANRPDLVDNYHVKIAGQNCIDSVGGKAIKGHPTTLIADFDPPDSSLNIRNLGSKKPLPLEYIPSGGDSGGGLFIHLNERWELVGICTGAGTNLEILMKTGYYCQLAEWTSVFNFQDWIKKCMQ